MFLCNLVQIMGKYIPFFCDLHDESAISVSLMCETLDT